MINLSEVDIDALPSLPIEHYRKLPTIPALYFAVSALRETLYIGQTANLFSRWQTHHRLRQLLRIGGVRIHWRIIGTSELVETESAAVDYFQPSLNDQAMTDEDVSHRTIKIRPLTYRALKVLAAERGETILDLIDRLVKQAQEKQQEQADRPVG